VSSSRYVSLRHFSHSNLGGDLPVELQPQLIDYSLDACTTSQRRIKQPSKNSAMPSKSSSAVTLDMSVLCQRMHLTPHKHTASTWERHLTLIRPHYDHSADHRVNVVMFVCVAVAIVVVRVVDVDFMEIYHQCESWSEELKG
jgi:hypothetical protein